MKTIEKNCVLSYRICTPDEDFQMHNSIDLFMRIKKQMPRLYNSFKRLHDQFNNFYPIQLGQWIVRTIHIQYINIFPRLNCLDRAISLVQHFSSLEHFACAPVVICMVIRFALFVID